MINRIIFFILLNCFSICSYAQQPKYTPKSFVREYNSKDFSPPAAPKQGPGRAYISEPIEIWDTDDDNTTHFRGGGLPVMVMFEGNYKNGKRNGIFSAYIFDSLDHSKRYKIWEQNLVNDKLDGEWKVYNLKGTVIQTHMYKADSLNGSSKFYWIDGKTVQEEKIYTNGSVNYINRSFGENGALKSEYTIRDKEVIVFAKEYYPTGKLHAETPIKNNNPEGLSKRYYETGILMEEVNFTDGKFNGAHKYYHPNGQLWIEKIYRDGAAWEIIANFDANGKSRDAGTLKNGTGTVIYYNDDGTIRETLSYENGRKK